ncbi:DUF2076 family protein [Oxalobacteraceae bacterium OM1]|nr:DUF2076 family protein [Oxalobacteraceae bacterium OM1]
MNAQESRMLQDFLEQLVQVRGITKDPEAEAMISRAVARQPDAAYLLVQRALLQQQAMEAAQAQIASLQSRLAAGGQERAGSFLDAAGAWGNSARVPAREPGYGQAAGQAAAPPVYGNAPGYAAPRPSFMQSMGGGGSFLGSMAATAAGVVGGAFLFQGIENLLHHGQGGAGQHGFGSFDDPAANYQPAADLAQTDSNLAADAGVDDIGIDDGSFDGGADGGDGSDSDAY